MPILRPDFHARYGPRALILGGSEGTGAAFAEELAAAGFALALVARRQDALDATAAAIRARHGVPVACHRLDLASPDAPDRLAALVAQIDPGLVVYNAGATHGVGLFLDQPVARALDLVRLNCMGTVAVAHAALSRMKARGRGGLILVSSMSAMAGSGYVAAYAATKSFDLLLAEGLHWEMRRVGVDVMCAVLTLTDTPAMARSGMAIDADPAMQAMDPADVAAAALPQLGHRAVWFAVGDEAAAAMRAAPREALSDAMSRASARLWDIAVDP